MYIFVSYFKPMQKRGSSVFRITYEVQNNQQLKKIPNILIKKITNMKPHPLPTLNNPTDPFKTVNKLPSDQEDSTEEASKENRI